MKIPVKKVSGNYLSAEGNESFCRSDPSGSGDTQQAPIATLMHQNFSDEDRATFGLWLVDIAPPDGYEWGGTFVEAAGMPEPVYSQISSPAAEALTLEQLRHVKSLAIDADFAAACDAIRAGYPPDEILSWPQQQLEAEAWAADNAAPTPLLAAMASARGVPVPELATRILANVAAYKAAYGQALGERQRRQAELAAVDLEAEGAAEAIAAV